jgi:hypothetical protein
MRGESSNSAQLIYQMNSTTDLAVSYAGAMAESSFLAAID